MQDPAQRALVNELASLKESSRAIESSAYRLAQDKQRLERSKIVLRDTLALKTAFLDVEKEGETAMQVLAFTAPSPSRCSHPHMPHALHMPLTHTCPSPLPSPSPSPRCSLRSRRPPGPPSTPSPPSPRRELVRPRHCQRTASPSLVCTRRARREDMRPIAHRASCSPTELEPELETKLNARLVARFEARLEPGGG